jgi:hypothetical protein
MVNRMELHNTTIPAKTYFKVVADKRIAVLIGGGANYNVQEGIGWTIHTYYPSTDGGFAGKEFIFKGFSQIMGDGPVTFATLHALENAKVDIYEAGRLAKSVEVKANVTLSDLKILRRIYRVVSTGRIILSTWGMFSFTVVPSADGGYVGKHFFVFPNELRGSQEIAALILINQDKTNNVQIVEPGKGIVAQKTLAPNTYWFIHSKEVDILRKGLVIKGSEDLMLFMGGTFLQFPSITYMSQGTTFLGIKANIPTTLYTFSKAIAFSPEADARVNIETIYLDIKKGGYAELPSGLIRITSNATLVIQVIAQNPFSFEQGSTMVPFEVPALVSWGAYMITAETVRINYPPPKSVKEEENALLYGGIGVAIASLLLLFFLKKRWKK